LRRFFLSSLSDFSMQIDLHCQIMPAKLTIEINTKTAPPPKRKLAFEPILNVPLETPSAITNGSN